MSKKSKSKSKSKGKDKSKNKGNVISKPSDAGIRINPLLSRGQTGSGPKPAKKKSKPKPDPEVVRGGRIETTPSKVKGKTGQKIKEIVGAKPKAPEKIDAKAVLNAADQAAGRTIADQRDDLSKVAGDLYKGQRDQIDALAKKLDNKDTKAARSAIDDALGQTNKLNTTARDLSDLGTFTSTAAQNLYANAGPTALENQIYGLGKSAMDVLAPQVSAPSAIREVTPSMAQAAMAGLSQGQSAQAGTVLGQSAMAALTQGQAAAMSPVASVRAQTIGAPAMGNFGQAQASRIAAGSVGQGAVGDSLMARALAGINAGGRLSSEASRDAVQSARQGFAARGLATGSAALGAELLNRDRFRRQREFEDLAFAQEVQAADQNRQFQNVANTLAAEQNNQSAAMQAELANLQARYNAAVQAGDWQMAAATQNQSAALQADLANQQTQFNTGQLNAANQQAMNLANMNAANQQSQFNAANQQAMNLANMTAQNQGNQFNAANTQAMNLANMAAANQQSEFNAANQQAANLANQTATNQASIANQARDQEMARLTQASELANQTATQNQTAQNRQFAIDASNLYNQGQLDRQAMSGTFAGLGASLLGASADVRNASGNLNVLGANALNALNPYAQAMATGQALGQSAQALGLGQVGGAYDNAQNFYGSTASFNTNLQADARNAYMNNATAIQTGQQAANAQTNAAQIAANASQPKWYETVIGAASNFLNPANWSDKRMKTDIKPIGKAGSILGLTAYEFRYKGEKKKHRGFMAQDVKKVLPEAVEEKTYKGKKRLAIKPMVLGMALAEELMSGKAA